MPLHLREDFCGSALVCTKWCLSDVRRTATGPSLRLPTCLPANICVLALHVRWMD